MPLLGRLNPSDLLPPEDRFPRQQFPRLAQNIPERPGSPRPKMVLPYKMTPKDERVAIEAEIDDQLAKGNFFTLDPKWSKEKQGYAIAHLKKTAPPQGWGANDEFRRDVSGLEAKLSRGLKVRLNLNDDQLQMYSRGNRELDFENPSRETPREQRHKGGDKYVGWDKPGLGARVAHGAMKILDVGSTPLAVPGVSYTESEPLVMRDLRHLAALPFQLASEGLKSVEKMEPHFLGPNLRFAGEMVNQIAKTYPSLLGFTAGRAGPVLKKAVTASGRAPLEYGGSRALAAFKVLRADIPGAKLGKYLRNIDLPTTGALNPLRLPAVWTRFKGGQTPKKVGHLFDREYGLPPATPGYDPVAEFKQFELGLTDRKDEAAAQIMDIMNETPEILKNSELIQRVVEGGLVRDPKTLQKFTAHLKTKPELAKKILPLLPAAQKYSEFFRQKGLGMAPGMGKSKLARVLNKEKAGAYGGKRGYVEDLKDFRGKTEAEVANERRSLSAGILKERTTPKRTRLPALAEAAQAAQEATALTASHTYFENLAKSGRKDIFLKVPRADDFRAMAGSMGEQRGGIQRSVQAERLRQARKSLRAEFRSEKKARDYVALPRSRETLGVGSRGALERETERFRQSLLNPVKPSSLIDKFTTKYWKPYSALYSLSAHTQNPGTNIGAIAAAGGPVGPKAMIETARAIRQKDPRLAELERMGLFASNPDTGSLAPLVHSLGTALDKLKGTTKRMSSEEFLDVLKKSQGQVRSHPMRWAGDIWQGEERLGKKFAAIPAMNRGATAKEAYNFAQRTLYDYGKVSDFEKTLRNNMFLSPFYTFSRFAVPQVARALVERPVFIKRHLTIPANEWNQSVGRKLNFNPTEAMDEYRREERKNLRRGAGWMDPLGWTDLVNEVSPNAYLPWAGQRRNARTLKPETGGIPEMVKPMTATILGAVLNPRGAIPFGLGPGYKIVSGMSQLAGADTGGPEGSYLMKQGPTIRNLVQNVGAPLLGAAGLPFGGSGLKLWDAILSDPRAPEWTNPVKKAFFPNRRPPMVPPAGPREKLVQAFLGPTTPGNPFYEQYKGAYEAQMAGQRDKSMLRKWLGKLATD